MPLTEFSEEETKQKRKRRLRKDLGEGRNSHFWQAGQKRPEAS
jgi:hypothetical protein